MKIREIECHYLDVPFTSHTQKHMQYWLPHWRIVQVCRITLENGVVGWGETIPNYTWARIPDDIEDRIVGHAAGDLLWDDSLGAGVQMALFDAVAQTLGVPVYRILGRKIRTWCPLSWWAMDMPPKDWARQCADAAKQGYMSAKIKARSWYDVHAGIQAIIKVVPKSFKLDLDFNRTLDSAANAVDFLKTLERYEQVAMIESPIPQGDVAGNKQIRQRINRPLAMHYGDPPIMTTLNQDVTDGFVLCAGASGLLKQATVCEAANKPFWLQLVGTGITTTWAAHLGAVCAQAKWPAITCMNIWKSQLIQQKIDVSGGYYAVPKRSGLGIEVDQAAIRKYKVDYSFVDPPRHIYRYVRANGQVAYYGCEKADLNTLYGADAMPICEIGSTLEVVTDDGSGRFKKLRAAVTGGQTVRRLELSKRRR